MLSRVLFFFVAILFAAPAFAADKPNFLIILADDLGYADTGFTGSKEIYTPELDRLARNGIVCRNGYVTHPYCGPSRAGLITGRYQARFGMEVNPSYSPYDLHMGLPVEEQTFANRLKPAGYRTGVIGKWHLGAAPPYHPNNRGFDYFYGFLSGGHDYFPSTVSTNFPLLLPNGSPHYSANEGCFLPLERNNNAGEFTEYLTTALSRDAGEFVRKSQQPFCLYLAYNAPHAPLQAPKETIAKYEHIEYKRRRAYAAMIDELDQGIGMVREALEQSGKLDNTVIFFLSDNGGVNRNNEDWANNAPFRKGKGSMLEGGVHVPFLVHWPAGLPNPGVFDGLVSALDIAATAIELGGGDASGEALDGVNLMPYLSGEKQGSPHKALFWRENEGSRWAVRTPAGKYLFDGSPEGVELFDMSADPYESVNLVAGDPDTRAELAALWNEWNSINQPSELLQADAYQRKRQALYNELQAEAEKAAARRKPKVID